MSTGGPSYPRIQYPRFQLYAVGRNPKKFGKLKRQFMSLKTRAKENGEIQQPKRPQYLIHLPFSPCPLFPAHLPTILLLAFSLFELVAALSQCLCSESNKKSGEVGEYPR